MRTGLLLCHFHGFATAPCFCCVVENLCKLFDAEYKFMCIVWEHEPVNSTTLTGICEKELGWKKSTTYPMIKKLCERGIMKNEKAIVKTPHYNPK